MEPVASLLKLAGLPASALDELTLTGSQTLPSSFQVGLAAQSTIAAAALAANELHSLRGGQRASIDVNMFRAELECTGYFRVDDEIPDVWATLSGLYPCKDGHVRIHANFDHHRDGALKVLGIIKPVDQVSKEDVILALKGWKAEDFETACNQKGMVVSAARTFESWDAHPHASVVKQKPLFTIHKIGEAPAKALPRFSDKPLSDIRALDLTRILAGPVCGRTLAAYGADVMLVNSPNLPNIDAIMETSRGKRSCHIDLKTETGKQQLAELVKGAHLFIQGYRPDGLASLGFSPEHVTELNPGIIYCSLSAYGNQGPWAGRRGFDSLVQTATGYNRAEAEAFGADQPKAMPVQILDYASGYLMAFASQAALIRQTIEGGSWHVEVSLVQTAEWLRKLGRITPVEPTKISFKDHVVRYESGFGVLDAIPHAAWFDGNPCEWDKPSMPPGTHEPVWTAMSASGQP